MIVLGIHIHSPMGLHEDRRSSFKILAMRAMFSRVFVIVDLLLLCSSRIDSPPSENALYQQNTVARCTAITINFMNHFKCFVALKPIFQQKRIAARCLIVFSITIYDMDKTDKLHHIVNMYFTVNSSSWNLAFVEKRVYWQSFPSFVEIALLVLCFRSIVAKLTG